MYLIRIVSPSITFSTLPIYDIIVKNRKKKTIFNKTSLQHNNNNMTYKKQNFTMNNRILLKHYQWNIICCFKL